MGQGDGENRDWYVTDKQKFPHGMKWLADYIRGKGLKPGIWLIPFNPPATRSCSADAPNCSFAAPTARASSRCATRRRARWEIDWTGRYAIDPTNPEGRKWGRRFVPHESAPTGATIT